MKNGLLYYILLMFLALALCACSKKALPVVTTTVKDSVHRKETIFNREKTILTKADSVAIQALVKCPDGFAEMPETTQTSEQATITTSVTKGVLKGKCKCSALEEKVKYQEKLIEEFRSQQKDKTTTPPPVMIKVKEIPTWFKVSFAALGVLFLLAVLTIFILLFIIKFK